MMGPYSTAMVYFDKYFADGIPIENNWMNRLNSQDFGNLINYSEAYESGMVRYDVGESANFVLTPMLTRALQQVNAWGPERIQAYTKELAAPYIYELKNAGFLIEDEDQRSSHLFGVRLPHHLDITLCFEAHKILFQLEAIPFEYLHICITQKESRQSNVSFPSQKLSLAFDYSQLIEIINILSLIFRITGSMYFIWQINPSIYLPWRSIQTNSSLKH